MKQYVSIDIGGTAVKYGIIDESGHILSRNAMETQAYQGGQAVLSKALSIVESSRKAGEISGVCISTAGMVDVHRGEIIHSAPLIPDYEGVCFKSAVQDKYGLPCEVENDVNCAGLAESVSGAAKGSRISLMLTVGTGIGGSIVIDGKVFRGFSGSACEVGYMTMGDSDFQTLGAASILSKKVAGWKKEPAKQWSGYRIFECAKEGDDLCLRAIDEMSDVLGEGIANICYVLNPEIVVLCGGIMAQEEFLRARIEAAIGKYLVSGIARHTRLAFAKHRNDAGMLGAFYHFRQRHPE